MKFAYWVIAWFIGLILAKTTLFTNVDINVIFVVWLLPVAFMSFLVMIGSREHR